MHRGLGDVIRALSFYAVVGLIIPNESKRHNSEYCSAHKAQAGGLILLSFLSVSVICICLIASQKNQALHIEIFPTYDLAVAYGISALAFAFGSLFLGDTGHWHNVVREFVIVLIGLFFLSLGVFRLRTRMYFNSVGLKRARFLGGEIVKVAYADIVEVKLLPNLSAEGVEATQKSASNLSVSLTLRSGETYNLNPSRFGSRKAVLRKILDCVSESTCIDPYIVRCISEQDGDADVKDLGP